MVLDTSVPSVYGNSTGKKSCMYPAVILRSRGLMVAPATHERLAGAGGGLLDVLEGRGVSVAGDLNGFPTRLEQVGMDARRAITAPGLDEQPQHLGIELAPALLARRH